MNTQNLHCRTIPQEFPFLKTLAGWILKEYGHSPAELTKVLILLPNRRSARALREAFLECTGGSPLLLPRMQPLGELDEEATLLADGDALAGIPPAIPALRRELLLTRMVRSHKTREHGYYNIEQAAQLARELGALLDDVARENLTLSQLSALVPEDLARHWQDTLEFLTIISRQWPEHLQREGAIDAIDHRTRLLKATAAAWAKSPPAHPVIAAGSTGSQPATAALLATVARLPQGLVILPGLDTAMPENEWDILTETHPQFALKTLLATLGCTREQLPPLTCLPPSFQRKLESHPPHREIPTFAGITSSQARNAVLSALFQPPSATAHWATTHIPLHEGLSGVSLITAPTQADEARMVAIALRETLETPEKTACLVTPDRILARMVASQLARLGIDIDDSAGYPLSHTPAGCFLRLTADMTASAAAPADLLALLRHPLAAAGETPAQCRKFTREIEPVLLRGLRRNPGLSALAEAATQKPERGKPLSPAAVAFLRHLAELEKPFRQLFEGGKPAPLRTLLQAHIAFAEALAQTPEEQGGARLWHADSGEQTAAFLAELLENASLLDEVEPQAYPGLFGLLLSAQTFRPKYGKHPRLHILSPIEARLQHFDRVILSSLNEGTWPQTSTPDPWMSRPMRAQFGLPATERSIGQSAHDFAMLCAAPEVILTRAEKVEGSPTIPSRWLVRLRTLVEGHDKSLYLHLQREHHYAQGLAHLHTPVPLPALPQPAYAPPLEARPTQLPATAIDLWVSNPYNLYAKYILKLKPLDALDEEPDAADYGTLIHKALELLVNDYPSGIIPDIARKLHDYGRKAFAPMMDRPAIATLWWPRFEAMIPWLAALENTRRETGAQIYSEATGIWAFNVDGTNFTLTAKLDRIEIANGKATIADYKTGKPASDSKVEEGLANQLPMQALVALHGTFETLQNPTSITGIEYWYLGGNAEKCDIFPISPEHIAPARTRLENLVRDYALELTSYIAPLNPTTAQERYNDYDHLTRRQEWDPV